MSIIIFTQSSKPISNVYIRIRQGEIDAKAKTQFLVETDRIVKGKFKDYKNPPGASAKTKVETSEKNKVLDGVRNNVHALRRTVLERFNNRELHETVDTQWLKNIISPKHEKKASNLLLDHFDNYIEDKKSTIANASKLKTNQIRNVLRLYSEGKKTVRFFDKKEKKWVKKLENVQKGHGPVYVAKINLEFQKDFIKWLGENDYGHNTKIQYLNVIKTVCKHSSIYRQAITHPELDILTKGLKDQKTAKIWLTESEIEQLASAKFDDKKLEYARDWLLISCHTAQRVSDFFKFKYEDTYLDEKDRFINLTQKKGKAEICIYLNEFIIRILKKYDDNFPPKFSTSEARNASRYNELIKDVCKEAGINNVITASIFQKESKRYKVVKVPKYLAVTSHIGRISFAKNNYGKYPVELLMSMTGHKTEQQFLDYATLPPINRMKQFASMFKDTLEKNRASNLKVVKRA